jgi:hypothetical protein
MHFSPHFDAPDSVILSIPPAAGRLAQRFVNIVVRGGYPKGFH